MGAVIVSGSAASRWRMGRARRGRHVPAGNLRILGLPYPLSRTALSLASFSRFRGGVAASEAKPSGPGRQSYVTTVAPRHAAGKHRLLTAAPARRPPFSPVDPTLAGASLPPWLLHPPRAVARSSPR